MSGRAKQGHFSNPKSSIKSDERGKQKT